MVSATPSRDRAPEDVPRAVVGPAAEADRRLCSSRQVAVRSADRRSTPRGARPRLRVVLHASPRRAAARERRRALRRALGHSAAIGGMLGERYWASGRVCLGVSRVRSPGDLGASERYFLPDLTEAHVLVDGDLAVPGGPGLGVELDEDVLASVLVRQVQIS